MSKIHSCTQFINVMVKVRPGDQKGEYKVHTAPASLCVTEPDTVINYQIYDSGEYDITFTGMTVIPVQNYQLSTPTVSISGKQLTFVDANTARVTLDITLEFQDQHGVRFTHDPQVKNDPQPN